MYQHYINGNVFEHNTLSEIDMAREVPDKIERCVEGRFLDMTNDGQFTRFDVAGVIAGEQAPQFDQIMCGAWTLVDICYACKHPNFFEGKDIIYPKEDEMLERKEERFRAHLCHFSTHYVELMTEHHDDLYRKLSLMQKKLWPVLKE